MPRAETPPNDYPPPSPSPFSPPLAPARRTQPSSTTPTRPQSTTPTRPQVTTPPPPQTPQVASPPQVTTPPPHNHSVLAGQAPTPPHGTVFQQTPSHPQSVTPLRSHFTPTPSQDGTPRTEASDGDGSIDEEYL